MVLTGLQRFIYFRLTSGGSPLTGQIQADFTIIFTRNNATPPDTLTIAEVGGGLYYATYTPTTPGVDYVDLYNATAAERATDTQEVVTPQLLTGSSGSTELTQNYPTSNALKVTQVSSPQTYTLYVFNYSDWINGNQAISYAIGHTALNSDGIWVDPIYVVPGTYTVVVISGSTTTVISQHLTV